MGCPDNSFKYLSSEANARETLVKEGAIDNQDKIIDKNKFKEQAKRFLDYVKKDFNLDVVSVITGRNMIAQFDKSVFAKIDKIRGYDKINKENINKALQPKREQVKPKEGVDFVFEQNPELANAVYEALGFKGERTIETAKGSTYRYLPSGKTQRFKKVEGKEYEPQDILTFVPNYEWIKSNNPQWLEKQGLENDTQYTQYLLEKVQGKDKVWIVDSRGKKIETNQDAKTADRLFIAFGKRDGTVEDFIPVSKEPVIGFYTYDSRIHFDEKGERYRDRHLGNKVVKITEAITPQQKQQAQQIYSQYLDTIFPDSKVSEIDNSLYNSVLNQLEQENKIEKDCTGGKLKAKDGIRGKFTKGGKWKIYEIFEGKSHKQGGIDINIKNNQISFTNKNGSIKAKYGLVISKENKL